MNVFRAAIKTPELIRHLLIQGQQRKHQKMCGICLKLTIKTPEQCQWHRSGVFIINFQHISHIDLVFSMLNLDWCIPTGNKFNWHSLIIKLIYSFRALNIWLSAGEQSTCRFYSSQLIEKLLRKFWIFSTGKGLGKGSQSI